MDSQPTDKVEGVGDDFARGGQNETPIKPKRNSRQRRIVVSAGTPTVIVTAGNEQFCAPWIVESPGGTVTTSAYNEDGKKRCLSAEEGSGDPIKKVLEQNKAFKRAFNKSGHRLSKDEIRAEAHKRQKEMRGAARAAEMTEEEVALEKLKGLAEKAAARTAAAGQAGKVKRATEEAKRRAATGQAGKDNHAGDRSQALGCYGASGHGQACRGRSQGLGCGGAGGQGRARISRSREQSCNGPGGHEYTRSGRCYALGQKEG